MRRTLQLLLSSLLCVTVAVTVGACSDSGSSTGNGNGTDNGTGTGPNFGNGDAGSGTSDPDAGSSGWTPDGGNGQPEAATCNNDADCTAPTPYCGLSGYCFECATDAHCPGDAVCNNGLCLAQSCTPGAKMCNGDRLLTCNATGTGWDIYDCPGEAGWCEDGVCIGCEPGYAACSGKSERVVCAVDGSALLTETCPGETFCVEGECLSCYPGTRQCLGDWVQLCNVAGGWENEENCSASGASCSGGICQSPCGMGGKLSNEGCDYWAVDMDNVGAAADSPYAVIVSNLNDYAVDVDITSQTSETAQPTTVAEGTVQPNGLEIFELPQQNMGTTGVFWKALRVQSTGPIVAYQFNPLDNVEVYSNDASLLLPSNTYGTEYIVVSREEIQSDPSNFHGSISIVANSPDTKVTINPSTTCMGGGGVLPLSAGQVATVTLEPYQVLNIQSNLLGGDLTGTIITSDKPIGVFAGHEAGVGGEQCCADHLEQQLFPVSTWGKTYVGTKSYPRGMEKDYWRVIAATDGTQVSVSPSLAGVPSTISLNRGDFYEFQTDQDIIITANHPVMVAQTLPSSFEGPGPINCTSDAQCLAGHSCVSPDLFGPTMCILDNDFCMTASDCPQGYNCVEGGLFGMSCQPVGDPALILSVPVEQFRENYVFLTPTNYLDDYLNIVASADTQVTLDGVVVSSNQFQAITDGTYRVARLKVSDGVHSLQASAPVGVIVYGYDDDVSYGYPAGLSLSNL